MMIAGQFARLLLESIAVPTGLEYDCFETVPKCFQVKNEMSGVRCGRRSPTANPRPA